MLKTIERMLRQQDGIYSATVALLAEKAVIEYDSSKWTPEKIAEEIEDIGFEAEVQQEIRQDVQSFKVYGMTCASCTSAVEQGVSSLAGVTSCSVSLATEEARIEFDPSLIGLRDLVECIEDLGFDAVLNDNSDSTQIESLSRAREVTEWWRAFIISLSFAIPVFFLSMVLPKWHTTRNILSWQPVSNLYFGDLLCFCLTTPVQFGVGKRFYVTSYKAMRHFSATMDVLIIIGTTASFVYSTGSMLFALFCTDACARPPTFFETSTMLITFVSFGRYLENSAKGKTSEALSKLIGLTPSTGVIYGGGEKLTNERKVPSELIQKGDYVKVIPGERIAADGIVVRGVSTVDESMVTGEANPVLKTEGNSVIGGTINSSGSFDFIVTRAGKETSLSQIVRLVSDAQTSKAPIQAMADRVAGIFVPSVVLLGAVTFIFWMCVSHIFQLQVLPDVFKQEGTTKLMVCLKLCISVIVVACPCALGLSTPTAVMVGTGVGASHGILIKGGGPLEASSTISYIMFDKTGTLTQGRLTVAGICWDDGDAATVNHEEDHELLNSEENLGQHTVSGLTRRQVLEIISSAERKSEHPLARAVASFIDTSVGKMQEHLVSGFENFVGNGIRCSVLLSGTAHKVVVGSSDFVLANCSARQDNVEQFIQQQSNQGRSLVFAGIDGALASVFSLADQLRPEAKQCIDGLRRMNIRCGMMTGDSQATATAIAKQLNIDKSDVHAGMSPNGKRAIIKKLKEELELQKPKQGVAMVGDGINDSPALAAATLGIAVGGGTEIAMEAASIVLLRQTLLDVAASLHLSRRIFRQIKLNHIWATGYNVLFIPLAMGIGLPWGIHLHPMMAGAAMAFSSVSVVLSSLTLKWWQPPSWLEENEPKDDSYLFHQATSPLGSIKTSLSSPSAHIFPFAKLTSLSNRLSALLGSKAQVQQQGYESVPMEAV